MMPPHQDKAELRAARARQEERWKSLGAWLTAQPPNDVAELRAGLLRLTQRPFDPSGLCGLALLALDEVLIRHFEAPRIADATDKLAADILGKLAEKGL